jgi:multiple sugar transport system ATP-binding protein
LAEYVGKEVIAGLRPETIRDEPVYLAEMAEWVIEAKVEVVELMGNEIILYLLAEETPLTARVPPRSTAKVEDVIKVALDVNKVHIFDKDTEKCLVH